MQCQLDYHPPRSTAPLNRPDHRHGGQPARDGVTPAYRVPSNRDLSFFLSLCVFLPLEFNPPSQWYTVRLAKRDEILEELSTKISEIFFPFIFLEKFLYLWYMERESNITFFSIASKFRDTYECVCIYIYTIIRDDYRRVNFFFLFS